MTWLFVVSRRRRPWVLALYTSSLLALAILFYWLSGDKNNLGWRVLPSWSVPTLSEADDDSFLGLSSREHRLAERVRDLQHQNQLLQNQLAGAEQRWRHSLTKKKQGGDDDGGGGDREKKGCKHGHRTSSSSGPVSPCEPIHIALVCSGYNATRSVVTLAKSILFYRKHPIHFHFITDQRSKDILQMLFDTWKMLQVSVSFYLSSSVEDDISWIPNKHYSGLYGLLKLTLPKILPESLPKVIVLDTDVTLVTDISPLWRLFRQFSQDNALGLVENQSDWYIPGKLWKTHQPWPALGRGFNTGVILMRLDRLRQLNWPQLWRLVAENDLLTMYTTSLADQDIFNAVIRQHPTLVHKLPCQWNLQLSDNTRSEICYSSVHDLNLIHFNSPKKLKVQNKAVEYFRNLFLTFEQYDGNLLRRDLIGCQNTNHSSSSSDNVQNSPEVAGVETDGQGDSKVEPAKAVKNVVEQEEESCYELRKARETVYRTHLYYMDYTPVSQSASFVKKADQSDDVTLVAQLSMDRLHMVESLCEQWSGPISLALYLSDAEAQQFVSYQLSSNVLKNRTNVGYHVVYKEGSFYPVNKLRNLALSQVETPYVFLSDIDFLPGLDVYGSLRRSISQHFRSDLATSGSGNRKRKRKQALIVPAFETQRYRLDRFPRSKAEVLELLDLGTLLTFRYHVWMQGHRATNFGKWRTATKPFKVKWEPDFEPYLVLPRDQTPRYDERFVGFGWNKVSHIMELQAQAYKFVVLPSVFIIHMPHAPSLDIARFRTSDQYRKCLKTLKFEFVGQLNQKYGTQFTVA